MLAYDTVNHWAYSDNSDIAAFDFLGAVDWHFRYKYDYERRGRLTATWAWDALEFA